VITIVSEMTPLHYLILVGCVDIFPRLYERIFTVPAVMREMDDPSTPQVVRQWATSPPGWLHVREPAHIEDISRLGHALRGGGE
jgi:predicted nucleic acid-binding protein